MTEEEEVSGTVHGLESPFALLDIKLEHIIFVVGPVTRRLPDTNVVHVRGLDFLVASLAVFRSQKSLKGVEDLGAVGKQERTARRSFVEEEKFLLLANAHVVTLLGLLQELQMFLHLLLVGECNTTDTLQGVVALVTQEVCGGVL